MPSSMLFASLVVLWLLILVPTVARRRQEVARPTMAALSGRVLQRPRPLRTEEVDGVPDIDVPDIETDGADRVADAPEPARSGRGSRDGAPAGPGDDGDDGGDGDPHWDRPEPRYRPGRGGFDPAAAALAARARYAFRQRAVLTLLVLAAGTAAAALLVAPVLWWLHGAVDVVLVGYLAHLRRQVRLEEAIRDRRAARMAGTRRSAAAEDPDLDGWARRGREAAGGRPADGSAAAVSPDASGVETPVDDPADDTTPDEESPDPAAGPDPAREEADADVAEEAEPEPALPRLRPVSPPSLPRGTALLGADDLDPDLPAFDRSRRDYRRAVGQ